MEVTAQDSAAGFAGDRATWVTAALTLRRGPVAGSLIELRRRTDDPQPGRVFGRERAANLTLDPGALAGRALPLPLSLDMRRLAAGGHRSTELAAGLLVSLSF